MKDTLINFFNFFINNVLNPIRDSLFETRIFDTIRNFINKLFPSLFKLWNNDNTAFDNFFETYTFSSLIAEILTLIILVFVIKIVISFFNVIYNAIRKAF